MSEKARCIYDYLKAHIAQHGYAPTYRQMATACGLASTGSVNYYLAQLATAGLIRREPGASRAITLVETVGDEA